MQESITRFVKIFREKMGTAETEEQLHRRAAPHRKDRSLTEWRLLLIIE